eukprot:2420683-Amphidinium_carterae.1
MSGLQAIRTGSSQRHMVQVIGPRVTRRTNGKMSPTATGTGRIGKTECRTCLKATGERASR